MKKMFLTLTSFGFALISGLKLVACIEQNDTEKDLPAELIKNDLQVAKQFLLKNQSTIDTVFAEKSADVYIDYIRSKYQDKINNKINFLFSENEFEVLLEGKQQILAILNHHGENETVNIKFEILPDLQVANNILNQTEEKLKENIKGFGLVATSCIDQLSINKIINLVKNHIDNSDIEVTWINNASLNSLEVGKENQMQLEISVKNETDVKIVSKIVNISIIDVLDSPKMVNQILIDEAEHKLQSLNGENLSEKDDLSSNELRQQITNLLQTVLKNPQINIKLLTNSATLKENNNKVKVSLSIDEQTENQVEREIDVIFSNVVGSEKFDNIIYLNEELPKILTSVDASKLQPGFSVNDSEVWQLINETINDPKVKLTKPPILERNVMVISNEIRWMKSLFGVTRRIPSKSTTVVKPKVPIKPTVKTRQKIKKPKQIVSSGKGVKKPKNTNVKDSPVDSKSFKQQQKNSSQQTDKNEQMEYFQTKIEQAEELSQSFINQLVDNNVSIEANDYNIFALATVGFDENAVTDIIPVKLNNMTLKN